MKIVHDQQRGVSVMHCEPGDLIGLVDRGPRAVFEPRPLDESGEMTWEIEEDGEYAWALFDVDGTLTAVGNYERVRAGWQYVFVEPEVTKRRNHGKDDGSQTEPER